MFPRKAPARECKKRVWKGRGETVMEIQQWLRGSGDDGDQFLERSKTTGVNPVGGKGLRPFCNDRSLGACNSRKGVEQLPAAQGSSWTEAQLCAFLGKSTSAEKWGS